MTNNKIVTLVTISFVVSMCVVNDISVKRITKQFEKRTALIVNGLSSAVDNALTHNMTTEELVDEMIQELMFINIVYG